MRQFGSERSGVRADETYRTVCAGSTRATAATSVEREEVDGRWARAFVAPWTAPAPSGATRPEIVIGEPLPNVARNPAPNVLTQALWIDADSLLPLRWDASYPADPDRGIPAKPYTRVWFGYDASIDVRPPDGVTPPDCIR